MTAVERFERLMDTIEYWTEDEPNRDAGPFRYLNEKIWIGQVCVTPGCSVSVAQLKTFLATEVLEIYPWNNGSKLSYRDVQKYLSGDESAKKYSFYFDILEKCFSMEEDSATAKKTQLSHASCRLMLNMEEGEVVSLYLLERLQTMARKKLGEYWCMCEQGVEFSEVKSGERIKWKQKQGGEEDKSSALKQNKYMECIMTIALHEIFTRECERQFDVLQEELDAKQGLIGVAKEEISTYVESMINGDEESSRAWLERLEGTVQEARKYIKELSEHIYLLTVYMEHIIGVEVEILLVMILEMNNLENMKQDENLRKQMTEYLRCIRNRNTETWWRYNKNKRKYYEQLKADMEHIFFRLMEKTPEKGRLKFSEALHTYMTIAEKGSFDEEDRHRLWEMQCILVGPLWWPFVKG